MKNFSNKTIGVEVTRGNMVESQHLVSAVLSKSDGTMEKIWGDPEMLVFPRSAVKPIQSVALVSSGAVEKFNLSSKEIALSCASHGGETNHVDLVKSWLSKLDLNETDLECGSHWPSHLESTHQMIAKGLYPETIHNNCSGKHMGFLTMALQFGYPHKNYIQQDHPVQQRVQKVLEEFCDVDFIQSQLAIDGCSVPTWAIPLRNLAMGFARWGSGTFLNPKFIQAARLILEAMVKHPHLVAGQGRCCTRVLNHFKGKVLVKTGAEGVYCASFPKLGLGLALKCHDGHNRASEAALVSIIQNLGLIDDNGAELLSPHKLRNHNNLLVGKIKVFIP